MVNISKHNRTLNLKNEIIEMGDSFNDSFKFLFGRAPSKVTERTQRDLESYLHSSPNLERGTSYSGPMSQCQHFRGPVYF